MIGFHDLRNARQLLSRLTDLRGQIVDHPLPAIGLAFAAGFYVALRGRVAVHKPHESAMHHKLLEALVGAVGTALIALARDAALRSARTWVEEHKGHNGKTERVVH